MFQLGTFTQHPVLGLISHNPYKIRYDKFIFLKRRGNLLKNIKILAQLNLSLLFGNVMKFYFFLNFFSEF